MKRRDFLTTTALLAGPSATAPVSHAAAPDMKDRTAAAPQSAYPRSRRRPNVVIVIADDTTPGYHGCYGGPTPTPHIDALARAGLRMERGYCCAALCSPSRYNIFTGQYTQRSSANLRGPASEPALVSQTGELEIGQMTLARLLRDADYFTGHFGKWHTRFNMEGFELPPIKLPEGDPDDPDVDAELRTQHARACEVVRRCAGFEVVDRTFWGNVDAKKGIDPRLYAHNPAWITDGALAFLDTALAQPGRPFYLHIANTVPHTPDCHLSLGMDHRYTWAGKLDHAPRSHPDDATVFERLRAANLPVEGPFAGVNAGQIMIDDQIGALVARLEAAGQLDNTLFIYTADHGLPGKGSCHHTGQHLPCIMRWPAGGMPAGRTLGEVFSWVNIAPTVAQACDTAFPDDCTVDGASVLSALTSCAGPWPAPVAYHEMGWSRSVIKGRYHYIATRYPGEAIAQMQSGDHTRAGIGIPTFDKLNAPFLPAYFDSDQLYDLALDPLEQHNLIDDPTRAAVVADLRAELRAITDRMPRPFPFEPHPFQRSPEYRALAAKRRAELAQVRHYPTKAAHIPTTVHGNYDDPDV
jgi:arylsulfatase A-like enzyme